MAVDVSGYICPSPMRVSANSPWNVVGMKFSSLHVHLPRLSQLALLYAQFSRKAFMHVAAVAAAYICHLLFLWLSA
jgi:hypothetical protein